MIIIIMMISHAAIISFRLTISLFAFSTCLLLSLFFVCFNYSCHSVRMSCWIKRLLLTYLLTYKLMDTVRNRTQLKLLRSQVLSISEIDLSNNLIKKLNNPTIWNKTYLWVGALENWRIQRRQETSYHRLLHVTVHKNAVNYFPTKTGFSADI